MDLGILRSKEEVVIDSSCRPFGLLAYKAEKDEEKQLLLNQKKTLKSQISITLQETTNRDVKKILEIFSRSLWKILRA